MSSCYYSHLIGVFHSAAQCHVIHSDYEQPNPAYSRHCPGNQNDLSTPAGHADVCTTRVAADNPMYISSDTCLRGALRESCSPEYMGMLIGI